VKLQRATVPEVRAEENSSGRLVPGGPADRAAFRRWALLALALHLAAAVLSSGWFAYDEHWQVVEFANAILDRTPRAELPWEYRARIRPSLQPFLYAGLEWLLLHLGVANPFVMAGVFRVVTSLGAFAATMLAGRVACRGFGGSPARRWVTPTLALTWFLPYLHARTSSENASEMAFLFGFATLALGLGSTEERRRELRAPAALLVGVLFGLAFELRYQAGFLVLGALLWCLVIARLRLGALALMGLGLLGAIAAGSLADRLFYGGWTLVPWNYFHVNVVEDRASDFGTNPWWAYFPLVVERVAPPLSLILLAGTLGGWIRRPRSLLTWSMAPFLLVHCLLGHKELRFLYPLATLALLVTLRSVDDLRTARPRVWGWLSSARLGRALVWMLVVENLVLLLAASFRPSYPAMPIYTHVYDLVRGPTTIYFQTADPYRYSSDMFLNFYRPPGLTMAPVAGYAELGRKVEEGDVWYVEKRFALPPEAGALVSQCTVEASTLPRWIQRFDFNRWIARTPTWTLYRCRAVPPAAAPPR
jgi:phosphatidylinositol glycan class B